MAVDRRAVMTALLTAMLPGCAKAGVKPKPADPDDFLARFLDSAGRIVDTGNGAISHSEGQGYGLLIAEANGDRERFDRIWAWTRHMLMRPDHLFSWRYDPKAAVPVNDTNNATDGDILIAWALLRAAARWPDGDYAPASRSIRDAVAAKLMPQHAGRLVLLPAVVGFSGGGRVTLNPSYYVWPALDAFALVDGGSWSRLRRDSAVLLRQMRFGAWSLPTDWVDLAPDGHVTPAAGRPPRFGFDAIRIPLYLAWARRRADLQPFAAFWSDCLRRKQPLPAWIDVSHGELAPFPLSAGAMTIVRLIVPSANDVATDDGEDYYSAALRSLAALARAR